MNMGMAAGDQRHDADQAPAWQATWQRGVRRDEHALVLTDLPDTRILAMSASASELLAAPDDGERLLCDFVESGYAHRALDLLALGAVETLHGRTRLRRGLGGTGLWWSARSVRAPDGSGDFAIVTLDRIGPQDGRLTPATPIPPRVLGDEASPGDAVAVISLDAQWRVAAVASRQTGAAPVVPIGADVLDLVCRDSRTNLLRALALATTGARAGVPLHVRLWAERQTHPVSAAVSMEHTEAGDRFVLEMYSLDEAGIVARAADLERRLRRIAAEIQGVDLMESNGRHLSVVTDPRLHGLTAKQLEIVTRLRRGERVSAIARSMYLAPSTVRNHLTAVFRKVGVNSQAELIEALR